ncbi:MAG: hypothetical protein WCX71_01590 [Candidatus Buchananbacteria bacterium]
MLCPSSTTEESAPRVKKPKKVTFVAEVSTVETPLTAAVEQPLHPPVAVIDFVTRKISPDPVVVAGRSCSKCYCRFATAETSVVAKDGGKVLLHYDCARALWREEDKKPETSPDQTADSPGLVSHIHIPGPEAARATV